MTRTAQLCALAALAVAAVGCGPHGSAEPGDSDPKARAVRLARETLIVDTHVDVPYRLTEKMDDISVRTTDGHFDYPRARAGGLDAPFMSIYIPASYQTEGGAAELADSLIDMVEGFETAWPDKFAVARSPEEVRRNFERGVVSLPMGMENGAPIENLDSLRHFHDRGIRYITLTHSENNAICDSSYADSRTWNGLSPFGEQVVAEMNRLGIMIDISHVSDEAFYDVLQLTRAPLIASHSSCRKFTPGWERNMDDDMIRALAANGGVVQINFGSAFLRQDAQEQSMEFWEAFKAYLEENSIEGDSEQAVRFREDYWQGRERIYGTLDDVVAQIDHVVELVGVDHVGFGSDFDGVDSLPEGLKDVSFYPDLIAALLEAGYSEQDIAKICSGNLLRVWEQVERVAEPPAEPPHERVEWAIAIHGGAGVIARDEYEALRQEYLDRLSAALELGKSVLETGGTSLDAVERVITLLEDDPRFNAGKGAVFNHEGRHELDASIMSGETLRCGAVAGVRTVKNPIVLARKVMEQSKHVLLVSDGAELFAERSGVELVDPDYFWTERRLKQWEQRQANPQAPDFLPKGTAGVAALDRHGNLAAGTSTGGLTDKAYGRVGDSPIIGAGTYADNRTCAVSCTGAGEEFIRNAVAFRISALMEYRGATVQEAAEEVVMKVLQPGDGGVIAVDRDGRIAMVFNTAGMFRGAADSGGRFEVAIWE